MKFDKKNIIYASLVFGWISIFWNVYDQLIQSINAYSFAFDPDDSGWILAIDNLLGLFVLPIFGHFSDRCKSKLGKRSPYIYAGTAISLVAFLLVGFFASERNIVGYIVSLCIALFAMAAYRSAGLSLVPDFVYEPQRDRANSIANLVSVAFTIVGIVLALIFMPLKMAQAANFMPITLAVAGSSLIVVAFYIWKFNEPAVISDYEKRLERYKTANPEKYRSETVVVEELNDAQMKGNLRNKICILSSLFFFFMAYNALVSNFTVYSDVILHFKVAQLPLIFVVVGALPGFLLAIKVTKKIGRKFTTALGLIVMCVALFLAMAFSQNTSTVMRVFLLISFLLAGIGYGFAMVNFYPMYLELSKAKNIGQNTGIFAGTTTAAMVVTPILAGWIIKSVGRTNGATYQIKQVIDGVATYVTKSGDYTVLFPYCAVAILLAFVCILCVKTDYTKTSVINKIKQRRNKSDK